MIQIFAQEYSINGLFKFSQDYKNIRITIIKAILDTVKQFTVKSINRKMKSAQEEAKVHLGQGINTNILANLDEELEMTLSWEKSNHFLSIVIEDGSLIFVYNDSKQIPQDIRKFIFINECINKNIQGPEINKLILKDQIQIPNFSQFTDFEFQNLLQMFRTHEKETSIKNDKYVVTADNFLKMCIIYLRVQSRVPVVIMGETGCGKTTLIRFFSKNILGDKLIIFKIHAGITGNMIQDKIQQSIQIANSMDQKKKLWLFFDEFNTTENLGLICEMLSERTIMGKPIPDNMCLLAACNPFKLRKNIPKFGENVGIYRAKGKNRMGKNLLTYTVYPIPENIIENVWDFGALKEKDVSKYINQMLIKDKIQNVPMITQMLMACHSYFNSNEDNSSVSLRDVSRFIILCKWFEESIKEKKRLATNESKNQQVKFDKYNLNVEDYSQITDIEVRASVLAMTHCYYLRISNIKSRLQFLEEVCIAQQYDVTLTPQKVLDIINCEQNDYINRMELPEGTAVNQALKENIFAIIPCIINRIPIFICGKPGCSKSMAITLVFQNLRGQKSIDSYFKTLKELAMVQFQGSESCTSEAIQQAFYKAKRIIQPDKNKYKKSNENYLPVFVFDEIGLAEISKYNPLKVLHSLLEGKKNRDIAFVGISNWRLDASKMNRALYLARPDPDEDDLKLTAVGIYQQICNSDIYRILIECLASSYFNLKEYFSNTMPELQDFYGLRDFYHMIKQISRVISKGQHNDPNHPEKNILYYVSLAIARNFGGRFGASEILGKEFSKKFNVLDQFPAAQKLTPKVRQLIQMNVSDRDSRYLMLIGKPDVLRLILDNYFKEQILESRTIVGSKLANDQNKEEYGFRALSDIILYVEKGISIILHGMEDIYSGLYDLFNQNFGVSEERRYCRIALGSLMRPFISVHENFHSIILMNEDDDSLKAADPPFLNRFEKHHVRLEDILSDHQKYVVNELNGWIDNLLKNKEKQPILLRETNIFPNFSDDMLAILVMQEKWPEDIDDDKEVIQLVIQNSKKRLLKFATQDILILARIGNIDEEEIKWIATNYQQVHLQPFLDILECQTKQRNNLQQNMTQKVLAITYTLRFDLSIQENSDGKINFRSISNFKSEQEVVKQLHMFYESKTELVFIIDLNYIIDKQHIDFVKFIVEKVEREAINGKAWKNCKTVVVMLHMQRNFHEICQSQVPVFDESWNQFVFYDTSREPFTLSQAIIQKETKELMMDQSVFKFEQSLKQMTEKCLLKLKFDDELNKDDEDSINDNIYFITENISVEPQLIECFQKKIFQQIDSSQGQIDWKNEICCNQDVITDSTNVWQAIKMVIESSYEEYLTVLLFQIEKQTAFKSYFTEITEIINGQKQEIRESIQLIKKIWIHSFNKLQTTQIKLQQLPLSNKAAFIANLKFPFSRSEAEILKEIYKAQIAFESADEETYQTRTKYFASQFIAKTQFGDVIDEIIQDKYVQELYVQDIVKIFLIENLLEPQYLSIVMIIMNKIMKNSNNSFYDKLYIFMKNEKLFYSLCTIFELFNRLKGDRLPLNVLESKFQQQLDEISESNVWEGIMRKFLDVYIIKNSYPDDQALQNLQSINIMSSIYEKFYSNLFNFKFTIKIKNLSIIKFWMEFTALVAEQDENQQKFLFKCSECAFNKGELYDDESHEDNLDPQKNKMNFMADIGFIQMVLIFYESGGKKIVDPMIKRKSSVLVEDDIQPEEFKGVDQQNEKKDQNELLNNSDSLQYQTNVTVDEIKEEEENKENNDDDIIIQHQNNINLDDRTVKFLSSFFTIIIEMNFKRLSIVAQRFQMSNYRSLFHYSSSIFQEIMTQTKVLDYVDQFRQNVQNEEVVVDVANNVIPEIELPDTQELQILEEVLSEVGLESKFAIAINDVITRHVSVNTEDRVYYLKYITKEFLPHQRLLVKLQDIETLKLKEIKYPNIKSLVAHSILKTIIDAYTDLIFKNNIEREKTENQQYDINYFEETQDLMEARLLIEDELTRRKWGSVRTMQMYSLKQLKQKMNTGNAQFKDALKLKYAPHAEWIQESEALQDEQEDILPLDSYPHLEEVSEAQEELIKDLKNFLIDRLDARKQRIIECLNQMKTVKDFLKTGLAFLKAFYLQYANTKQATNLAELNIFYQEHLEQIAEQKCGEQYARLLKCFISNFPRDNFLRMENQLSQMDMHQRVLSCQILLHVFANTTMPNPISSLFYSYDADGKFTLDLAQFNICYMPGVELDYKYKYLFDLYTNFEDWKNNSGVDGYGTTYFCGDHCDYFYIAENCGHLAHAGQCPWCGLEIGPLNGMYDKVQRRKGFKQLKQKEAKESLKKRLTLFEQKMQPGYSRVEQPNPDEIQLKFYKMRPVSWRLIRQFVHLPMHFLLTVGGCTQESFDKEVSEEILQDQFNMTENETEEKFQMNLKEFKIFSKYERENKIHTRHTISLNEIRKKFNMTTTQFLQSHIVNDFKVLEKLLSIGGQDHIAPWLYSVINRYSTFFKAGQGMDLQCNQNARAFEEAFDEQVLGDLHQKIGDVAIQYKNQLQVNQGRAMSDFDAAFQETAVINYIYPGLQFYRLVRAQSFENMITSFKNVKANEHSFPVIKVCINKYESLLKLKHLSPIIEFTNHLIRKFSHTITREEARQKKIKEFFQDKEDGEQIKNLFDEFQNAWTGMGPGNFQFDCHIIPKVLYNEHTELINFLADDQENGGGIAMIAAMQELGNLQNNILTEVLNEYAKKKQLQSNHVLSTHQYLIQMIKPDHIAKFSIDDPQMIQAFTMNSLEYGHGQEIVYDFGRMEMNLLTDFEKMKFVQTKADSFELIQYQNEINSSRNGNFISEIRMHIKQSPFDQQTSNKIEQFFESIESKGEEDKFQTLRELHGGLLKILCFLRNTREAEEITIQEFVNKKMKGNKHAEYSGNTTFSKVKLKYILALYEKLEEKYFPHATKCIKSEYTSMRNEIKIHEALKVMLNFSEVSLNGTAFDEKQLIPTRKQIQNGLLRFIIRCLAGEYNSQHLLGDWFVSKHDVWDEELQEQQNYKLQNLKERLNATSIRMEDIYCTYKVMHKLNLEKENRALAPQIGQQGILRVDKKLNNIQMPSGGHQSRQTQNSQLQPKMSMGKAKIQGSQYR